MSVAISNVRSRKSYCKHGIIKFKREFLVLVEWIMSIVLGAVGNALQAWFRLLHSRDGVGCIDHHCRGHEVSGYGCQSRARTWGGGTSTWWHWWTQAGLRRWPQFTESECIFSDSWNVYYNHSSIFQSLCQDCLEKLQSAYEFKFRCEENRNFLRNYLKECADGKLAEERAIKEAALAALDLDLDNLDSLPDKLVLKDLKKEKKPRKPRDPNRPMVVRRRRIPEKNVIIDEHSQTDSAAYVRKIITTPEQSPEQRGNKRKSKHVIIEDILVNDKRNKKSETKVGKEKFSGSIDLSIISEPESLLMKPDVKPKKFIPDDDEPMFEDDENFEAEPKRSKRLKK